MATEVREDAEAREREDRGARVRETKRRTRVALALAGGLVLGGFFVWIMVRMASSASGDFALPMLLGFLIVAAAVAVSAKLWAADAASSEDDADDSDGTA
jgi:heme A synthase